MHKFALFKGDGIGPEVMDEALKCLARAADAFGFRYEVTEFPYCSQHYLDTGELMPDEAIDELRAFDAVLVGAIGDPRVAEIGLIERNVIAGIRFGLDLYVNLRPVKLLSPRICPLKNRAPEDVDIVIVRENTEGLYVGTYGFMHRGTPHETATQTLMFTRHGVERVVRYAFETARSRRKHLTLVDKANALRSYDLWRRVFEEVGAEYPDVERDYAYIDAACMWLVLNPDRFDTVVVSNMFGDILTDVGAAVQGGLGIAAGGNIHPGKTSMFEPIHGSAPKYAGKGVANPLAAIESVAMALDYVGEPAAASALHAAVAQLLTSGAVSDLSARSGLSTAQVGDMAVEAIKVP